MSSAYYKFSYTQTKQPFGSAIEDIGDMWEQTVIIRGEFLRCSEVEVKSLNMVLFPSLPLFFFLSFSLCVAL